MEGFIFYDSFYKALSKLKADDQAKCLKALCDYALYDIMPDEDDNIVNMFFELVKPQVDKNKQRYINGCKGGAPKGNQNAKKTTNIEPKDNQKQPKLTKINQTEKSAGKNNLNINKNINRNININNNKKENNIKEKSLVALEKANTPQAEVFEFFAKLYKQETNIDYLGKGIDYINLAKLIKKYGKALVIQKIKWLLVGCKHSIFFFSKDMTDFNISTLTAQWDRILPKLTDEQKKEQEKLTKEAEKKKWVMEQLKKQGIVIDENSSKGGLSVIS